MPFWKRNPQDVGPEAIEAIFSSMRIDEEWSVRRPRGFSWWGHRLRQDITARPAIQARGMVICQLQARTGLVRDVPASDRMEKIVSTMNAHAALNAIVLDRGTRQLYLSSSMVLHREMLDWGLPLFASAVATQAAEAEIMANRLSDLGVGELDESPHSTSGWRTEPDDMLSLIEALYAPEGEKPSRFPSADFERIGRSRTGPSVLTNADGASLTAEFPFTGSTSAVLQAGQAQGEQAFLGPETALFRASAEEEHPRYGSGCLLLLRLPLQNVTPQVANQLNLAEANEDYPGYGLGAWCESDGTAVHACFLPSIDYRPGLLDALMLDRALRARWARDRVLRSGLGSSSQ